MEEPARSVTVSREKLGMTPQLRQSFSFFRSTLSEVDRRTPPLSQSALRASAQNWRRFQIKNILHQTRTRTGQKTRKARSFPLPSRSQNRRRSAVPRLLQATSDYSRYQNRAGKSAFVGGYDEGENTAASAAVVPMWPRFWGSSKRSAPGVFII